MPGGGSSSNGSTVSAYQVATWPGLPPAFNTTPPYTSTLTCTTGPSFGSDGSWEIALPTNEDYFICVQDVTTSDYHWRRYTGALFLDGIVGQLDVTAETIAGESAWGLSPDALGFNVQKIAGTGSQTGSASGGSISIAAYIDHVHNGLGDPLGIVPGTATSRYVGGTSGTPPDDPMTFQDGDFAIDSNGIVWIYNYLANTWNPVVSSANAGTVGDIKPNASVATSIPGGWFLCNGQAISRSSFGALFSAVSHSFTAVTTANSASITIPNPTDYDVVQVGWAIEGADIPYGATITGKSGSAITISITVPATGGHTELVTAAPWGLGDHVPTTGTFNVPDLRSRTLLGSSSFPASGTFTVTASGTNTLTTLTMTGSSTTEQISVGMPISGTGIPSATTVAAVMSPTEIAISKAMTATTVGQTYTITTNLTARFPGGIGGEELHPLVPLEIAAHTHTITVMGESGHAHSYPSDGFMAVQNTSPPWGANYPWSPGQQGAGVAYGTGGSTGHTHTGSSDGGVSGGTSLTNPGTGHNTMQPFIGVNYYIKS